MRASAQGRPVPGRIGPRPSRIGITLPAGHRWAAWILTALTFVALAATGLVWEVGAPGSWTGTVLIAVILSQLVLIGRGHFRIRMAPGTTSGVPPVVTAIAAAGLAVIAAGALRLVEAPPPELLAELLAGLVVAALVAHGIGGRCIRRLWSRGSGRSRALVYGTGPLAIEMAIELQVRHDYGVDVVGFVSEVMPPEGEHLPLPVIPTRLLAAAIERAEIDRLIIGPSTSSDDAAAVAAARLASGRGLSVFVVPRLYEMGMGLDSKTPDRIRGYPLLRLQRSAHPTISLRIKRLVDIAVSLPLLVVTSPLCLVAAVAVKLSGPGPILFEQVRVGQHGRLIRIRKFRSMQSSAASDTEWVADARITRIGALLRRTNVDELPQLWSILMGDMSLVGPRPERPAFVERFAHEIPDYHLRHRMPVGLTGLAQIAGLRGDTPIAERVKYDNLYIDQWSLRGDLHLLVRTVFAILRQERTSAQVTRLATALQREAVPEAA